MIKFKSVDILYIKIYISIVILLQAFIFLKTIEYKPVIDIIIIIFIAIPISVIGLLIPAYFITKLVKERNGKDND